MKRPPVIQAPAEPREVKRGQVAPTNQRGRVFQDHLPPSTSWRNNGGSLWRGTSRVRDRAARRHANALSWAKLKNEARRKAVHDRRLRDVLTAELEGLT